MLVSQKITQQATALKSLLQPDMTQEDVAVANIQLNGILAEAERVAGMETVAVVVAEETH